MWAFRIYQRIKNSGKETNKTSSRLNIYDKTSTTIYDWTYYTHSCIFSLQKHNIHYSATKTIMYKNVQYDNIAMVYTQ